ncbi:MAG: ABC transporter ATP-binding protein [Clostridia bacterium]|nr:ABC transporter ATP-binding protein [Clostridia bacterium]MBQ6475785.1 ABC transporter ATP-binding protein [Clostridia bacterium]MBR0445571.1 ABC transporter ATP-binding protein [Clostridia bacterium]MCR5073955.1 ABC transporter ATP-binding protein [Clostridiales bacterium]
MEKTLTIRNLSVSFSTSNGTVRAVRNVDLDLYKGETLAIVGESGSGKSVTVKAVMGITSNNQTIESGSILYRYEQNENWTERELLKLTHNEMRQQINGTHIAMVFQDPMTSLDPTMTIGMQLMEGMMHHLHLSKQAARKRALELLELVGITDSEKRMRNYPHQLSGGMRQRVVIAIALSCNPDILICDEPTTALDVTIQAKILELIKEIQEKTGISVIYITHDLGVVAKVADYVAVMYAGRIVEKGTVDDIFYDPRHPYTWGLLSSMPDLSIDNSERLYTIPGSPPNMVNLPAGDPFAPRNQFALEADYKEESPTFKISDTHFAATWLLDERAPHVEMPVSLRRRIDAMKEGGVSHA